MKEKNYKIIYPLIILFGVILITGISFAIYKVSQTGKENSITTGKINFSYIENENALTVTNTDSLTDSEGKKQSDYFEFSIKASATGIVDVSYYIYLTKDTSSTAPDNAIKVYLSKVNTDGTEQEVVTSLMSNLTKIIPDTLSKSTTSNDFLLHSNYFSFNNNSATQTLNFRFRMWADKTYFDSNQGTITEGNGSHSITTNSKSYKVTINVKGTDGKPITIS